MVVLAEAIPNYLTLGRDHREGKSRRLDVETAPEWFHEGQREAWNSLAQEIIGCCGTQGGKTAFEPHWLLREILLCHRQIQELELSDDPKVRLAIQQLNGRYAFLYVGPTLTLLEAQAIPLFEDLFVQEHKLGRLIKGNKPKFVFSPEGAKRLLGKELEVTIHFGYANDPNNLESITALAGVWDEGGQKDNKRASLRAFNRRLKIARSLGMGRRFNGTTPYEWNFFKTDLVDFANIPTKLTDDLRVHKSEDGSTELIQWSSWLNPLVSKEECERELSRMSIEEYEMMYMGLFTRPKGKIYDCWDSELNTCPAFEIPEWWDRFVGMDYGPNNTAAVFFAEEQTDYSKPSKPTGRMILYRTYLKGGMTTREHVSEVRRLAGGLRPPFVRGGNHTEEATREAFTMAGLPTVEPRHNEVIAGIKQVYAWIKTRNLVCFSTLDKFVDEVNTYSWELDDNDNVTDKIRNKAAYHRCFVAGTSVWTRAGHRPIETIRVGDEVMTRRGWRKVVKTGSHEAEVISRFGLTGTPEHPIWTKNRGWVALDELTQRDTLYTEACLNGEFSTASTTTGIPSLRGRRTPDTLSMAPAICTATFGSRFMVLSRRVITSITGMAISATTRLGILSCCTGRTIRGFTSRKSGEIRHAPTLSGYAPLRLRGSATQRITASCRTLVAGVGRIGGWLLEGAIIAGQALRLATPGRHGSALTLASRHGGGNPVLMTSTGFVDAGRRSESTDTPRGGGVRTVYALSVDDCHEYFANGVLVSNCDATRYISFLAFKEFVPKVKSKSRFDPHVQAQRIR